MQAKKRCGSSFRPGQRSALLRALDAWSLDLDGYEPIPPDVLGLRNALIADLYGSFLEDRRAS